MKQFQHTITLTFFVEHVSDDPEYEKAVALATQLAADETIIEAKTALSNSIAHRNLGQHITAGGWGVDAKVEK